MAAAPAPTDLQPLIDGLNTHYQAEQLQAAS